VRSETVHCLSAEGSSNFPQIVLLTNGIASGRGPSVGNSECQPDK
jgi:hypothetical protein